MANEVGRMVMLAASLILLTACNSLRAPDSAVVRYEYKRQDGRSFVRVEQIERDAPVNDLPTTVTPDQMRMALASVRDKGRVLGTDQPLFAAAELDEIASPLASAVSSAASTQDVTFVALGSHGLFGGYSPPTLTTGRAFVRSGKLNLIFGRVHVSDESLDGPATANPTEPGVRKARIEEGWTLTASGAEMVGRRGDWFQFDLASLSHMKKSSDAATSPVTDRSAPASSIPAAPTAPSAAASASDDPRYRDMASKLRILDRLRADGLISDEEYHERRKAILQSL